MLLRLLVLSLLLYLLVCVVIFLWQEQLIFFPERNQPGTRYVFGHPAEEVWLTAEDAQLHALWFRVPEPQGVILYLHGNAGSLRTWGAVAPELVAYQYDLLIIDYRGYGQSSGQIRREADVYADAEAAYAWILERYREDQVVLYGRSLGSAPATRLAAEHQPRMLILETPFYSLEALARRQFPWLPPFLLKYPLNVSASLGQVSCPVVIIHGTEDEIVPFADGERLADRVAAPLRFYPIAGGRHNNLATLPAYWDAITATLVQ
ncbi:MAG: alpha/beta fold hydrolase [Chloroflexia bacterium]|nr:alpha/beta fold hydrolase [Chloroflexia bacterium]